MPPSQIGPYRLVRPLGEGGMGAVYEAIQQPIERRVAVKVLLQQHAQNQDALNRFFNEARAVNLIEHPSIVQVSDYGQAPDGTAYLVMEYLRGETLGSRLERLLAAGSRLSVIDAAQIAAQIADALTAAHDKSIVHRDLKPGNVMLVRDPVAPGGERAKILDFGIAKLTQGSAHGTATNAVMGTPQYMSPEQCRGAGGVDNKTDVYALGVMLYEMLAGRPPFLAESAIEYMGQHVFQEPLPLRGFAPKANPEVVALVHRLLIKDKSTRPTMRQVCTELFQILSKLSGSAMPVLTPFSGPDDTTRHSEVLVSSPSTLGGSPGQTLRPGSRQRRRVGMVIAVAGLAGVCAIGFGVHRWSQPAAPRPAAQPRTTSAPYHPPGSPPVPALPAPAPLLPAALPTPTSGPGTSGAALPTTPLLPVAKPDATLDKPSVAVSPPTAATPGSGQVTAGKPPVVRRPVQNPVRPAKLSVEPGPPGKLPRPTRPNANAPIQYED